MVFKLWPKQQEIVDKVLAYKYSSVVRLGFRSGKTTMAMWLTNEYLKMDKNVVYVTSTLDMARTLFNVYVDLFDVASGCCFVKDLKVNYYATKCMQEVCDASVKFRSGESFLNMDEGYDVVIVDEPDLLHFKSVARKSLFCSEIIKCNYGGDVKVVLIGTPAVSDDTSLMYSLPGNVIKMSTCEVNPLFTREMLEEEFKFAIDRIKRDFLIED